MNILFITQLFPCDGEGKHTSGALREFVEEWGRNGHHVKVIRPHFRYEQEPFPSRRGFSIGDNIDVEFVRPFRIPLLKFSWYNNKKIIRDLQFKPDVVICHLYNSYFTFYRIAKELGIPLIVGIHKSDVLLARNRFHYRHQKKVFRHASAFACRSLAYMKSFIDIFPEYRDNTFPALSGIPGRYIENSTRIFSTKTSSQTNRVISVCRLIKLKQIDKVLHVLAGLPENIDWEYTIIGSGREEQFLRKTSIDLGIAHKVKFKGTLGRDVVMKELSESDIFIMPSYTETLGLAYIEAMACGCITIGSLNEGIDGVIKDGENGFLCDARNYESIKQKMLQAFSLSKSQREEMVIRGLQTSREFSVENKALEYLENIRKYTN